MDAPLASGADRDAASNGVVVDQRLGQCSPYRLSRLMNGTLEDMERCKGEEEPGLVGGSERNVTGRRWLRRQNERRWGGLGYYEAYLVMIRFI